MKRTIDLLNGRIFPSLTGLALPIMVTSLVQMAYNLTDMAWIGRVGAPALASVGAAGMYIWLSQGVVALPRMGGQIKVAHSLGGGDQDEAASYAACAIQMGIVLAILYAAVMVIGAKPLIGFFGLNDKATVDHAEIYLRITCGCTLFPFLNAIFTGIFTASGDSRTPLLANAIGLVVNIVLDPVLIFGIGPFPRLEIVGAAAATVLAQAIVTMVFLTAARADQVIFHKVRLGKPASAYHIGMVARLGVPAMIQNLIYTSISMVLTKFVAGFGVSAVAVQRLGSQIESISWMTADGFASAVNSFTGQNYGARQLDRVKRGYFTAVSVMFVWGLFCSGLLIVLPGPIFELFIREPEVVPMGIDYLRILGYSQMFMCIEITTVGALSGLGKTFLSSFVSVLLTSARIPLAVFLSATALGLGGIWWAYSVSSIAKGILFFLCYLWVLKKMENVIRMQNEKRA